MKQLIFGFLFLFGFYAYSLGQVPDKEGSLVKWMSLEEAMAKMETQPRPIILDFYTDWCGWCKHMMKTTYATPNLAEYINANFYPVKFDAEGKDTIEYLGQVYKPVSDAPRTTHPLAAKLLQNKLMYPSTLFLNNYDKAKKEFAFSMMAQGFLEAKKIEPILIFTLENVFRNSGYDDFKLQFDKAFYTPDSTAAEVLWKKPSEVLGIRDSSDKKTLVLVHTDWCNSCRVMKGTSFSHPWVAKYLSQKFDLVDFNAEISDTIKFKGQAFTNPRSPQMPFHQLAAALCRNAITLPSMVVMDEKQNVVDVIPFYVGPAEIRNIILFYGDNAYKTKSWNEFISESK